MKRYSIVVAAALFLAACGNANKTEESAAAGDKTPATTETSTTPASAPIAKVTDPVCGMERGEEQWTEFAVKGTDTSWFCSPHCKETFEKNPDKYKKATEEKKG